MISRSKVMREIKSVGVVTLYFAVCFGVLLFLKRLILAQYDITFVGLSVALVGALVAAKVVLVLEHVPLGPWIRRRSMAIDIVSRTILYTLGVLVVTLIEKAFDARHDAGGLGPALVWVVRHRDMDHVLATTIGVSGPLLVFNIWSALDKRLGHGELYRLFFATRLAELEATRPETAAASARPQSPR